MSRAQESTFTSGGGGDPARDGLCLLSLDGGGVRGLSSLIILEQLMASVNFKAGNS